MVKLIASFGAGVLTCLVGFGFFARGMTCTFDDIEMVPAPAHRFETSMSVPGWCKDSALKALEAAEELSYEIHPIDADAGWNSGAEWMIFSGGSIDNRAQVQQLATDAFVIERTDYSGPHALEFLASDIQSFFERGWGDVVMVRVANGSLVLSTPPTRPIDQ